MRILSVRQHGVFGAVGILAELQRYNRCLQQSGVYSLPQIETTMFIAGRV